MKKILHYLDRITKEYQVTKEIDTAFYGTNIPHTTEGELLPFKNGFARCFYSNKCEYVEDNRNKDIHKMETKEDFICHYLGSLKAGFALGKYVMTAAEKKAESKNKILDTAKADYIEKVNSLTAGIPNTETSTWNKQEIEAREYLKDDSANVPFIKALSEARGVDLLSLATKILEKADMYAVAVGTLTGERQKIEDNLS